jgi:hypothetical protein
MKSIVGGVLEYRNAVRGLRHIQYSWTRCDFISQGEKGERTLDLFSSGFFLLEKYIEIDREMHGT